MTGPTVVIRCGASYPDAVVERLALEVAAGGLPARIEDLWPGDDDVDTGGLIAVDLATGDPGVLTGEAMGTALAVVLDVARRRYRRQLASGDVRDVAVILHLPDGVRVVVGPDAPADRPDPLLADLARRLASGDLAAGTWTWDPAALRLDPVAPPPDGPDA